MFFCFSFFLCNVTTRRQYNNIIYCRKYGWLDILTVCAEIEKSKNIKPTFTVFIYLLLEYVDE